MGEHPRGRIVVWVLVAFAGLAVAVALSVAASNLSTQPIGLSAEPLRAGDRLAPADVTHTRTAVRKAKRKVRKKAAATPRSTTRIAPAPATGPVPVPPSAVAGPTTTSSSGSGSDDRVGDDHGGRDSDHDDD